MNVDDPDELMDWLRQIATECVSKGPGYAQEGVVLRDARRKIGPKSLTQEQLILEAWQRLFIDGELSWGYDLDNPGPPFFHAVTQKASTEVGAR